MGTIVNPRYRGISLRNITEIPLDFARDDGSK